MIQSNLHNYLKFLRTKYHLKWTKKSSLDTISLPIFTEKYVFLICAIIKRLLVFYIKLYSFGIVVAAWLNNQEKFTILN